MKIFLTIATLLALPPAAEAGYAGLRILERGRTVHAGKITTISLGGSNIRLVSERKGALGDVLSYACLVSATVAAEDAFLTIQELAAHARDANRLILCHSTGNATSDGPGSWVHEAEQLEVK